MLDVLLFVVIMNESRRYITMSGSYQPTLSQSKTTIAKTPPPTATATATATKTIKTVTDNSNNNRQTTSAIQGQQQQQKRQEQKQRLQLYNSLFGQDKNKLCEKTGLQFTQSLNYSVHTFLNLSDKYWVLAMIDVDEYDNFVEKYGE